MTTSTAQLFHSLTYADAERGLAFLTAIGFDQVLVVRSDGDPTVIEHAQLRWRDNGGVMLGSVRPGNPHACPETAGTARCYLVLPTDTDVDDTFARALDGGADTVEAPADQPYGGRGATVRDMEGNHWSFGSYAGE